VGRGASLDEKLGADEARVLVVEAIGKQKSVGSIALALRTPSQGRAQEGELAHRTPLVR
jgi:hypothetical protein